MLQSDFQNVAGTVSGVEGMNLEGVGILGVIGIQYKRSFPNLLNREVQVSWLALQCFEIKRI